MNNFLCIGKITGPFGINGELKVSGSDRNLEKIFVPNARIYIDYNPYIIKSVRVHKNHYLILLESFNTIKEVEMFFNKKIYIDRQDFNLSEEYFYSDLLNALVKDNGKDVGTVKEVLYSGDTTFIKLDNLIIPLIPKYLEKVDIYKKIIYVKSSEELKI